MGLDFWSKQALDGVKYGGLKWETAPPTQEGWYWAIPQSGVFRNAWNTLVVYVYEEPDTHCLMVLEDTPLVDFSHWLGPLPAPEPPTESE
jgi:hypothetical protein